MSNRIKTAEVATASSIQGFGRQALRGEKEISVLRVRNHKTADSSRSIMQNRQGYCNCCHVHYINLEQHIISPQHRYFATYCRYRLGTNSLLDRFLHDVMQYHPHQYYDNRPTYDDIPLLSRPSPPKEAQLDIDQVPEKGAEMETLGDGEDSSMKDLKSIEDSCSSCKSQKDMGEVSLRHTVIQTRTNEEQLPMEDSQEETMCIDNNMQIPEENIQTTNSSHKIQFTPVITELSSSVNSLPQDPAVSPVVTENASLSSPETQSVSVIKCTPNRKDTCNNDIQFDKCSNSFESSLQLGTSSVLRQSPKVGQGNSFDMTSGENSETKLSSIGTVPVNEVVEDVILPNIQPSQEEESPFFNISAILDHESTTDSEMSFDCDTPFESVADQHTLAVKEIDFLTEVHVDLEDENYQSRLSSVLKVSSLGDAQPANVNTVEHHDEPVLPALPHVPPSFVGKTWTQIMYEDDLKIEAMVREFREGRNFRCYFDDEPETKKTSKNKQKGGTSANALPEFNDTASVCSFDNFSEASDTLCNAPPAKRPKKQTWRMASRCQVVKVSHGTQTSVIDYSVFGRHVFSEQELLDNETGIWLENDRTPNTSTRFCTLKLPESYTKILSPVQPETVVYVLSCPETNQNKAILDELKMRRNHNSIDNDSIKYKYKRCSFKYYDPMTNRVLKTTPTDLLGDKVKKPAHVRQLFKSLNLNVKLNKGVASQKECLPASQSSNLLDLDSSTSDPDKGDDLTSSQKLDGSSLSSAEEDDLTSSQKQDGPSFSSEDYEVLIDSPADESYQQSAVSLLDTMHVQIENYSRSASFKQTVAKTPVKSIRSELLVKKNPKKIWERKEANSKNTGFSRKASGPMVLHHGIARVRIKDTSEKQIPWVRSRRNEIIRKYISPLLSKYSAVLGCGHLARKTVVGKYLRTQKLDFKMLKKRKRPRKMFLNSTVTSGATETPERASAESILEQSEWTSSKVTRWEVSDDQRLLNTEKQPSRTATLPALSCPTGTPLFNTETLSLPTTSGKLNEKMN
ncbi:DBF4-type zinc finger-containing protein 2 isoform X1 [Vombatus ursinus]|uniref:DBF4-type zinc finger-containing protein 2 isoform X1 n=3 Tax=Vombatus ursinus TaxID=29139 RepID=UPI000FFDB04B|nr:DBF4-type zinc finger-containing protein 2 isoform X1 [Vombatus ursinus]XP_027729296.1 DBF4-type zinc finger-containing protein 2 isoform X1 [Vombatus ursinus]XP_027729297.1 DBF4-type zinc finger-containing protein 2 isoform X1 [Vombatus ursinus]XP_027729298.1 DBF4-type zinc finger-containing protein 2 isoform X1 [Vombatus ursinus]